MEVAMCFFLGNRIKISDQNKSSTFSQSPSCAPWIFLIQGLSEGGVWSAVPVITLHHPEAWDTLSRAPIFLSWEGELGKPHLPPLPPTETRPVSPGPASGVPHHGESMQMVTTTPISQMEARTLPPGMAAVTVLPPRPVTPVTPAGKTPSPSTCVQSLCEPTFLVRGTEALCSRSHSSRSFWGGPKRPSPVYPFSIIPR